MYAYSGFLASPGSTVQIGGERAVDLFEGYKEFADQYMIQHDIHNHTIIDKTINVTTSDLSGIANDLPKMVEAELAECSTKIKVPVLWNIPAVMSGVSSISGTISVSGIKRSNITAQITVQNPSGSSSLLSSQRTSSSASSLYSEEDSSDEISDTHGSSQTPTSSEIFSGEEQSSLTQDRKSVV